MQVCRDLIQQVLSLQTRLPADLTASLQTLVKEYEKEICQSRSGSDMSGGSEGDDAQAIVPQNFPQFPGKGLLDSIAQAIKVCSLPRAPIMPL